MLEALSRNASTSNQLAPLASPITEPGIGSVIAKEAVPEQVGTDELDVSFIEVGGPRSTIDASPDVLAAKLPVPPSLKAASESAEVPASLDLIEPSSCGTVSIWCSWNLRSGMNRS
jgi:hypothetical protein